MPRSVLTGALLLSLGMAMIPGIASAADEEFYLLYLERKIAVCEILARSIDSKMDCVSRDAEARRRMAEYLRDNKEALILELAAENMEPKPYKIDYFLIKRHRPIWLHNTPSD